MIQKIRRSILILTTVALLTSCTKNPEEFIEHIEGYWEIEKVTLKNGSIKEYNYNDTIDFISLEDSLNGIRKKLKPNFMGTFETSDDAETFQIKIENDSLNIYYETAFDSWKETILLATKDQLKVINKYDAVFLYKRYEPLNLD
ncbi:hypothetical protein [Bizionia myxarmorum]|uniref:Lipocalin-like domain-containing protein n=1 Tax=Bizionia myxarmorum TaxID=291186 RepID=A0A5D0R846_9FLAO|nr:hypothetical protein [Bizionia myxarmorum]TYB77051.1 hypothetical protein ES674_10175 [Bizionia myxarmorum]